LEAGHDVGSGSRGVATKVFHVPLIATVFVFVLMLLLTAPHPWSCAQGRKHGRHSANDWLRQRTY